MISFYKIFYVSFIELLIPVYFLYRYLMGSDPNVVCFSLKNETLWKFIDIQNDIPFMEISKSHKDNNHLFYTYVWDNIIQNARNDEVQSGSTDQID